MGTELMDMSIFFAGSEKKRGPHSHFVGFKVETAARK